MALCAALCSLEISAFNDNYFKVTQKIPLTKEVSLSQKRARSMRNYLLNRCVIFDIILTPKPRRNLEKNVNLKVIDPTGKELQDNLIKIKSKNKNVAASFVPNKIGTYQVNLLKKYRN